ncbi:Ubiquinone/menaquinone biosynthesis C-methylase UbiE [Actinomadura meyerae]|uniref:Ubiquinone/menaquinone biosynthesis C-methylase UbiE n=1 Tax=Actinomadura meyerae TaxID=240840 RepID=A0A239NPE0_9ACTN|nr:class I SAM-dependent methyltransferase [Actinomadura meyerae]SNT56532.1 Ubiquinone/menaquinone biosynthesis C-methylase UbiE [Actinomadura meyerae]
MSEVDEITRQTCGCYDANASSYGEASEDYARFPGLRTEVADFARLAPHHMPVLDLGCGGGRDTRLLASLGRTVIAGDYAPAMLEWARSRSREEGRTLGYLRLNALALPLRDGSVAGVWASGSLLHIPSAGMERALAEVHRVLVPSGIAAISMRAGDGEGWKEGGSLDGRRWFTFVDPDAFAGRLEAAGFTDVRIRFAGRAGWFIAVGTR